MPLGEYKERTPDHLYNCLYVPTFGIEIYQTRQGTQGQNELTYTNSS
ncbi:hypothetical protein N39L_59860 [Limnospira platensis NIES-39]|uniref:Uncharacterized protein n=1 Tax=Limnospira platensis NIES-46 TaxID=1236695 RepID=A0A5M3T545_LIMPL|nr:hypothetical protein N39L_59860 [Arthrospira platensis NIES-39]GCE94604.1 hypothetical protein NIES46_26630 [Arthrospira platensis NIES-46]